MLELFARAEWILLEDAVFVLRQKKIPHFFVNMLNITLIFCIL